MSNRPMTSTVLEQLRSIPGAMVHEVLGPFDVIVDLETDTQEDATGILRNKIRPIHGVTNTVNLCMYLGPYSVPVIDPES